MSGTASHGADRPVERHTVSLPVNTHAVTLARHTAQRTFTAWGVPFDSSTDAVLLVTSELVTNVVRHARTAAHLDLTVSAGAGLLGVAVHDEDPALPPWPPNTTASGTGLRTLSDVVDRLGGTLTMRPTPAGGGKTISAVLPTPAGRT